MTSKRIPTERRQELLREIRGLFGLGYGVAVNLTSNMPDHQAYRLTVGPIGNSMNMAENCKIWSGTSLIYSGSMFCKEFDLALDNMEVCLAEVYSVSDRSRGKRSHYICLGDPGCHQCTPGEKDVKPESVSITEDISGRSESN